MEDRRTTHAERIDNTRNLIVLKPGDIVMDRTAIQRNKKREKVAKSTYTVRDPYKIILTTDHGSCFVRKLHRPDCLELKCMTYDILCPHLLRLASMWTRQIRGISTSHTLLQSIP